MVITELIEKFKPIKVTVKLIINFTLYLIKKKNEFLYKNSNKILIVSLHKIGDTIFTIPSVRYLHYKFKDKITIICYDNSAILYKKFIDEKINFIIIDKRDLSFNRYVKGSALKVLSIFSFNYVFDLTGSITSVSILNKIYSKQKYGFTDNYLYTAYNYYCIKKERAPLWSMYFDVIKLFDENANLDQYLKLFKKNIDKIKIAIHPFAGWKAKEWDLDKFIRLYKDLSKNYDVNFIIDKERLIPELEKRLEIEKVKYFISKSLEELLNNLTNYSLFIGNDSGPMHLAVFLGIPTFTIYGPTNPLFHKPNVPYHESINITVSCSPKENEKMCIKYGGQVGCNYFECIDKLEYDFVFNKVTSFISFLIRSDK